MPYQTRQFYELQGRLILEGKLSFDPSSDEIRHIVLSMFDNLNAGLLLDIGIGPNPLNDIELLNRGFSVVAIDVSHSFIIAARRMFYQKGLEPKFIVSEAINLPFRSDTFDLCLCSEVIEHLREPEALLKDINRVLKRGGKLILTTPNRVSLGSAIFRIKHIFDKKIITVDSSHAKEYTYYEIIGACKKFFKLVAHYHTGILPIKGHSFPEAILGKIRKFIVSLP